MRDHRIVLGGRVLGDVEILLNVASRIGQKRPKWRPSKARLSRSFRVTTPFGAGEAVCSSFSFTAKAPA
jgi:hypothetical protein